MNETIHHVLQFLDIEDIKSILLIAAGVCVLYLVALYRDCKQLNKRKQVGRESNDALSKLNKNKKEEKDNE